MNRHQPNGRIFPNCDCWGLVCHVYMRELNIDLDKCLNFDKDTMTAGYNQVKSHFVEVKEPKDLDVVCWFKFGILVHVGIYADGHILHTSSKSGSCFEPYKKSQFIKIYRYKEEK